MMPSYLGSPSLQDARRVMHNMDGIFDSILVDFDNAFYDPLIPSQRMTSPPPQLLQHRGTHALDPLLIPSTTRPRNTYEITQDNKQYKFVMDVQFSEASNIDLRLDEDGRVLRISGDSKREDGNISVHSRFDRSFVLNRDIDTSKISAQIDDGVLTIIAPKYEANEVKENTRRINIDVNKKVESASSGEVGDTPSTHKVDESPGMVQQIDEIEHVDETVIDLDMKKD